MYLVVSKRGFVIIQFRGDRDRDEFLGDDVMISMIKVEF